MSKFVQIKGEELRELRHKQWTEQKGICPILKQAIRFEDSVFDHKHITRKEIEDGKIGEEGKGLLRGVLHDQANVMEGKIARLYKRYGLNKFIDLPGLLRNIASYLENPPMPQKYIHPSEKPRAKKLSKRDYNRIKKYYFEMYPKRRKMPEYPKSGKTTREWETMIEKANELGSPHEKKKTR